MAHRHICNMSQMFDADPDQQWNQLHSEEPYLHFARTDSTENAPLFHPGENVSVDRVHYASQWTTPAISNGYSSSTQMVNPPHYPPDSSDPSRDSLHQSIPPNVCIIPENHVHHASSSNYGVESNFFDLSVGHGRGPYKRKSPGIPAVSERGSTSRYYSTGSSSDASSLSEIRQEKLTLDAPHNRWEPFTGPPCYRASHLSIGGESSDRNVRSRSSMDLESDDFRTHLRGHHSHHHSTSWLPVDYPGYVDHQNSSAPLPEWTPVHLPGGPHGRILSSNMGHESSHFFAGSSVTHASGELAGYHQEHISGRNSAVPQSMHTIPSHRRGVRSSYTHRSTPNSRVSMGNVRMVGHMVPHNEDLQLVGDSHSSRHLRPFGPSGWRNGDRNGRPRLSSERYCLFSEDTSTHGHRTPEGHMIVDRSLYGSRNMLDHHRDMRLDIDNMSYEELLALGERIGSVSTGVGQDQFHECLIETVYCSSDQVQEEGRCVICLYEYQEMDNVGTLKVCGHDYHVKCIKKWLSMKNSCPVCKGPVVPDK